MEFALNRTLELIPNLRVVPRLKDSPDPSHLIFEIDVGKRRIRQDNDRVVPCRIRFFPTLISKGKWLGSELPLN